jgi:hypothetical protein
MLRAGGSCPAKYEKGGGRIHLTSMSDSSPSGDKDWIDLDFVKRERTPEPAMALGFKLRCGTLTVEYRRFTRCPGCPMVAESDPRLGAESRFTA